MEVVAAALVAASIRKVELSLEDSLRQSLRRGILEELEDEEMAELLLYRMQELLLLSCSQHEWVCAALGGLIISTRHPFLDDLPV